MDKRLIRLGNSLALVIDKPHRRVLGLGPSTRVRLRCVGNELVIRAVQESESDQKAIVVEPVVRHPKEVIAKLQLTECEFAALHPTGGPFAPWLRRIHYPNEETLTVMRRFERVLELLEAGIPRGAAIAAVEQLCRTNSL